MLNDVNAPKKDEIAIPTIKSTATSVLVLLLEILKIINATITDTINPQIPYITSGKLKIYAITAPSVALAEIPII